MSKSTYLDSKLLSRRDETRSFKDQFSNTFLEILYLYSIFKRVSQSYYISFVVLEYRTNKYIQLKGIAVDLEHRYCNNFKQPTA